MINLGVVYDISDNKVIVLSEEGFFVPVKKRDNIYIGQLIKYRNDEVFLPKSNRFKLSHSIAGIAAVFALIISMFLVRNTFMLETAFGYVCIDINPSVELSINKDYKVLKTTFFNDDAKKLFHDLDLKGNSLSNAVALMIDKSKEAGIITEGSSTVLISTAINDENLKDKERENNVLDEFVDFIDKEAKSVAQKRVGKVEMVVISMQERKTALENNMSMGRYSLYDKAIKLGLNVHINDFKTGKISDILDKLEVQNAASVNKESITTNPALSPKVSADNKHTVIAGSQALDPTKGSKLIADITETTGTKEDPTTKKLEEILLLTPTMTKKTTIALIPTETKTSVAATPIPVTIVRATFTPTPKTQEPEKCVTPVDENNTKITFYENTGYNGNAKMKGFEVCLPIGRYTAAQLRAKCIEEDKISSIKIPADKGLEVVIYEDDNFKGQCHILRKSVDNLRTLEANDKISSIVIRKKK